MLQDIADPVPQEEIDQILLVCTTKRKLIETIIDKKNSKMSFVYLIEGQRDAINSGVKKFYDKDWFESVKVE